MEVLKLQDLLMDGEANQVDINKIPKKYHVIEDLKFIWSEEHQDHILDLSWFEENKPKEEE